MSEPLASNTRPYVDAFADAMEAKLADNRHKGDRDGWAAMPAHRLLDLMRGEVEELAAALVAASPQDVVSECADVANFAMMIADVAGGLAPKIEPREVRVPVPEGVRVVLVSEQFVDSFEARSVDGSRRIKARLGQPNAHGVSDLTFESHDEPLPALAAAQNVDLDALRERIAVVEGERDRQFEFNAQRIARYAALESENVKLREALKEVADAAADVLADFTIDVEHGPVHEVRTYEGTDYECNDSCIACALEEKRARMSDALRMFGALADTPTGSRDALRALLTEAVERARREEATDSALIASLLGEDS